MSEAQVGTIVNELALRPRPATRLRERAAGIDLCVFVPVCEPPRELTRLFWEHKAVLEGAGRRYEFLFLAEPWARAAVEPLVRLSERGEPITVLEVGQNIGESMLLRAAAAYHPAQTIITLPPYPRIAPEGILQLLERVEAGADLAVARRGTDGQPWLGRLQRRVFHWLLERVVGGGSSYADVGSGVRAIRRAVLEEVPLHGDFFRFLPLLADRAGFRVDEVLLPAHPSSGQPKLYSPGIYLGRALDLLGLLVLVRFTQKPLRFFGLIGGLLGAIGGAILFVLFVQRLGGESLANRPILLLGVMLAVLGVQAIALGLLGEIFVHLGFGEGPSYRLARTEPGGEGAEQGSPIDALEVAERGGVE